MVEVVDIAIRYSATSLQRKHSPRGRYSAARNCLRLEFTFSCAYCLSAESLVAPAERFGGFEIDHFVPQKLRKDLVHAYTNLIWSCAECNGVKRQTWPTDGEVAAGFRFVDPTVEPLAAHLAIVGCLVQPLTTAGKYMVEVLTLNSLVQQHRRSMRERKIVAFETAQARFMLLKEQVVADSTLRLDAELADLATLLRDVERELGRQPPWDAPAACACAPTARRRPRTRRERRRARRS
jgi:hypothetical protein